MILHRLAGAVREQSWLTVFIELLVVVVGIFMGLQVDDWNERRKDLAQEVVYLALLQDDVESMLADMTDRSAGAETRRQTMIAALRALEVGDMSAEAQRAVGFALMGYQVLPSPQYLDATFNEMVATGALARIEDIELKQAIASAFSSMGRLSERLISFRASLTIVDQIVWQNVSYGLAGAGERMSVSFDLAVLSQKPEVRNAFVEMIDMQSDAKGVYSDAISQAERLLAQLSARTGRPARRPEATG